MTIQNKLEQCSTFEEEIKLLTEELQKLKLSERNLQKSYVTGLMNLQTNYDDLLRIISKKLEEVNKELSEKSQEEDNGLHM